MYPVAERRWAYANISGCFPTQRQYRVGAMLTDVARYFNGFRKRIYSVNCAAEPHGRKAKEKISLPVHA